MMSYVHPKLHIVLTAKTKHADFVCSLCKKVFISAYHLNRHKSRRHSVHFKFEDKLKAKDPLLLYQNAIKERLKSRSVVNASSRMEKLLRNLSLEEMKLFGNDNKMNSTTYGQIPTSIDPFPYDCGLSPVVSISCNVKNKFNESSTSCPKNKRIGKVISSNAVHISDRVLSAKCEEPKRKDCFIGQQTKSELSQKKHNSDKQISLESERLTEIDNQNINFSNRLVSKSVSSEPSVSEIEILPNENPSSIQLVINNNNKSKDLVMTAEMSTQTENTIQELIHSSFKCSSNNVYYGSNILTRELLEDGNNLTEDHLNCQTSSYLAKIDCSKVSVEQDNAIFEKEFQESFDARKNLLEKEDYLLIDGCDIVLSDNETRLQSEKNKQNLGIKKDSSYSPSKGFEVTNLNQRELNNSIKESDNFLLAKHFNGDDIDTSKNEIVTHCEKIAEADEKVDISGPEDIANKELDETILPQEELNNSFEESYNQCLIKVECALSTRLRHIGVDPTWSGITDKVFEKTLTLLAVKRTNISKKIPGFMSMRTMLNNTIDQILEGKNPG